MALFLGVTWILFHGAAYNTIWQTNELPNAELFTKSHKAIGVIDTLIVVNMMPNEGDDYRINFIIEELDGIKLNEKIHVRLNWRYNNSEVLSLENEKVSEKNHPPFIVKKPRLGQHQQWQLPIKFKPAHGLANAGTFHYQTWLRANQLHATGYVQKGKALLLQSNVSFRQQLFTLSQHQLEKIENSHQLSKLSVAIMHALTFGVRAYLTKDHWQVLQVTGTQHLIAISGLHIGLVAAACFYLVIIFRWLLPIRILSLSLQHKLSSVRSYYVAIIFSLTVVVLYGYLAGFSSPTLRAITMLSLYWFMKVNALSVSRTRLLLLTVCINVLIEPMSLISVSFWLSFYAVTVIFFSHWFFYTYFQHKKLWLKICYSLLLMQLSLSVFILPFAAFLQYQIPLAAFIANILAVPFMSFIILPLTLLAWLSLLFVLPWAEHLTLFASSSIDLLWQWLTLFSQRNSQVNNQDNWLMINISQQQIIIVLAVIFFSLLFFIRYRHQTNKRKATFLCIAMLFLPMGYWAVKQFTHQHLWQLVVLDVGQGSAFVVIKNNRAILYDTGANYPSGFILAEAVIAPFLKSKGITQLDRVYLSHSDNDHSGGITWLQENIFIKQLISNDNKFKPTENCYAPQQNQWQGLTIKVLWPLKSNAANSSGKQINDQSCVLAISDGIQQVLLTGDISSKVEEKLIEIHSKYLQSVMLTAPHHGSNSSSSKAFLSAVNPTYGVFSAGFMNRWSMPTEPVQQRYKESNIITYSTANSGMVTFTFNLHEIDVKEYRNQQYGYWFGN